VEDRFEAVKIGTYSHRVYLPLDLSEPPGITFGHKIQLLASHIDETHLASTGQLRVTLFWRALRQVGGDYTIYLKLINPAYHIWGQQDSRPYHDGSPTWTWQEGQLIYDPRQLKLLPGTPPGEYHIEVIPVEIYSTEVLESDTGESVLLGPVEVPRRVPPPVEALDIEHPQEAILGDKVRLLGYNMESGFRPGDNVHLTLFWQCLAEMEQSYTVFVHLVDGGDNIVAQKDNPPVDGFYPATRWKPGEIIRDQYDLIISPETPLGRYRIEVGMYLAETGERLQMLSNDGSVRDDKVMLGTVEVVSHP